MRISYSIRPILRNDKAPKLNGKYPIHLLIRLNKQLIKVSTSKEIESKFWDQKTGRVTGGGNKQLFNAMLDQKQNHFEQFMLKQETMGMEVTRTQIKDFFASRGKLKTFFEFWDHQTKLWEGIKRPSTLESYRKTLMILKLFKPTLNYGDLTLDLVEEFDHYLRTKRNNSDGGVFNRHKCLKAMIKIAIKKELMEKNPYTNFRIRTALGKRMHLEISEVQEIMKLSFELTNDHFEQVKNMFLFACFTGLRFSDISNLKWTDIDFKAKRLRIQMIKTGKEQQMMLIEPAIEILYKYKERNAIQVGLVFKPLSNQFVNRSLKTIVAIAQIKKQITFHCARHTFACTHLQSNTHMLVLRDLLGHSSVGQTEIYAKTMNVQLIDAMHQLEAGYKIKQLSNQKKQIA